MITSDASRTRATKTTIIVAGTVVACQRSGRVAPRGRSGEKPQPLLPSVIRKSDCQQHGTPPSWSWAGLRPVQSPLRFALWRDQMRL